VSLVLAGPAATDEPFRRPRGSPQLRAAADHWIADVVLGIVVDEIHRDRGAFGNLNG